MRVAAVDLGASSGRVMLVDVASDRLSLREIRRFANDPVTVNGRLTWDIQHLYAEVVAGLRTAQAEAPDLAGVGIDSWAIDYGLLDREGRLLSGPVHYRDRRTDGVPARLHAVVPPAELYATTGIQELPFNTVVQLYAERDSAELARAATLLLIPDLLGYWLTGQLGAERTNASTTQMYDVRHGQWATDLLDRLGLPSAVLPPLREPGSVVGPLLPSVLSEGSGSTDTPAPVVVAVGSHDTASAVVAVPMADPEHAAYISSGTWSLVGLELAAPVLTEASRQANFTNEVGVDGTIRFLRNVMGLWLLQESLRTWKAGGAPQDLATLLADAASLPSLARVFDPDDPSLLPPGDQPQRIAALLAASGQPAATTPAELVRAILDSLALAYRRAARVAGSLAGREVRVVHVVGGGARNTLLCQLTADACGVPVLAGPVEAAAIGNALVQARALGALGGGLPELRELVSRTQEVVRYEPRGDESAWAAAESRVPRA